MPAYRIELTESARADLACCRQLGNAAGALHRAFEQGLIVSQIKEQLQREPLRETRNRKMLRDNISEADDFDAEVEALRNSRRFQQFLDERMRDKTRLPIEQIEKEIAEELQKT